MFLVLCCSFELIADSDKAEAYRDLTKEWIKLEKLRSQEKNEFEAELELLDQLKKSLEKDMLYWRNKAASLKLETTKSDEVKGRWVEKRNELLHFKSSALNTLASLRAKLNVLLPKLPILLKKKLELNLMKFSSKNESLSWLEQYSNLLSILRGVSDFNRQYTVGYEEITLTSNKDVVFVTVLYRGLSGAYFLSQNKKIAGIGQPTNKGWEWRVDNNIKSELSKAIELCEGHSSQFSYSKLPVEVVK